MAPCGGKKRRVRNPIPVWLPRPCLRSLNSPGPPYYIPLPPEMYLPPWAMPPSYFTKPICHCANEDFCTTRSCRNSTDCLKKHPMFCPHGTKHENSLDSQEQKQDDEDQETSSNSDMNICSACGAPSNNLRTLNKRNVSRQNNTSNGIRTQDSFTNPHNIQQNNNDLGENVQFQREKMYIKENHLTPRERDNSTDWNHGSPDIVRSKRTSNGCINTTCQTPHLNSRTKGNKPKTKRRFSESSTSYAENSETSLHRNVSTTSNINKTPDNIMYDEFNCSNCTEPRDNRAIDFDDNPTKSMCNLMHKEFVGRAKKTITDRIHVYQLPDKLSNTRKRKVNKSATCCIPGSEKSCENDKEIGTISKSIETPINNITKSRKRSECACYSKATDTSAKPRQVTDCICSSTKTSELQKASKCDGCPSKMPNKHAFTPNQISECECSSTNITQKKSFNLRKVSDCSCHSTDIPVKASSKSRNVSERGLSSTEEKTSNPCSTTKITSKKSTKVLKDMSSSCISNTRQSSCQCKFPPAFKHLNCSGNDTDTCSCNDNT